MRVYASKNIKSKTRDELSNMSDEKLITYCYNNMLFFKQYTFSTISRNRFLQLVYQAQYDLIQESFYDIVDNTNYYEREGNTRYYLICTTCGHVLNGHIDNDSQYLDLHGKCGSPMYYGSYTDEEIYEMKHNREESQRYASYFMKDFYAEQRKDSIEYWTNIARKAWYYGYK